MYWNSVMRLLLPAALAILLLVLIPEGIAGGFSAVERMISSGFPLVLLILIAGVLAAVFAILLLQGKELSDFVVDSRGVHESRYLPNPTRLKLILRLKSPSLMNGDAGQVLLLFRRDLAWKDVARVQLWPEKCMILFYAPGWWLRIPVLCTPFSWEDVIGMIREKLGKKRKVRLPASAVPPAERTPVQAPEQLRMEDLEPAVPEEWPAADITPETTPSADFGGDEPNA